MEIKQSEYAPKPQETIPSLYVKLLNCSIQARSELSKISADRDSFTRFPDEAYKYFQGFIGQTKDQLPQAISYTPVSDDKDTYYYLPHANTIYMIPSSMITNPKYDPNSQQFIGLDNIKQERGGVFAFEGEEADIDSIGSILKSIEPLLTTDQGKSLFQTTTEAVDRLKQQFDVDYKKKQNEWTEQLKNQTVKLLQEIRSLVGEKKLPTYVITVPLFGLMGMVGKREIDPGTKMPYLLTNEGKIVRAPVIVIVIEQKLFLKETVYAPDLTKAEDADDKEWLNPALPNVLLNLMPRSTRRNAEIAVKK